MESYMELQKVIIPSQRKKGFLIADSFLIIFIALLTINRPLVYSDLAIAIVTYTISWYIVSYSVKRFGPGGKDRSSLQKELIWFGVILTAFLGLLTIVTQADDGLRIMDYAIITTAFSFTWIIRSYAIKRFTAQKIKQK